MREAVTIAAILGTGLMLAVSPAARSEDSSDDSGGNFGDRIAATGDLDGDGVGDIAVSAPLVPGGGAVHLFSGKTGRLLLTVRGPGGTDRLGQSLCGAGDLDGDGKPDLLAGARIKDRDSVLAFSGATGKILRTFVHTPASDLFGTCLASRGDFDGDRVPDFLASATSESPGGLASAGAVLVISGKTGLTLVTVAGTAAGEGLGLSMATAGDLDGDGVGDVLASGKAPKEDRDEGNFVLNLFPTEFLRIYSGKTGKVIRSIEGSRGGMERSSILGAGDLDGDGKGDVVAGYSMHQRATPQSRGALVFTGMVRATSSATGKAIWTRFGEVEKDVFGSTVADAGDADGDGIGDVAVAAGFDAEPAQLAKKCRIEILSGKTGTTIRTIRAPDSGEFLVPGRHLACVGDIDGDGKPELAALSAVATGGLKGAWTTRVRVYAGKDGKPVLLLQPPADAPPPGKSPR